MTDLVLIHPNSRGAYGTLTLTDLPAVEPPLWCRLIAGYCLDRGWDVKIVDAEAEHLSPFEVAARVARIEPKLVVVVATGHQPSASTQAMPAAGSTLRALTIIAQGTRTLLVGGHVSALPERSLREEHCDYVCEGEGPATVHALLAELSLPMPHLDRVPGLWYRQGDAFVSTPRAPLVPVEQLRGDAWGLLPMDRYRAHNWQCFEGSSRQPYAAIYTTLGCPFSCSFCCINAPFGKPSYRTRDPAEVVAEIVALHDAYGVKTFKVIDEMFVLNKRHVEQICRGLAALPYADELNLWAYARVDTVDRVDLELMRRAGFRWLAIGIEAADGAVRDGADKSMTEADIVYAVATVQSYGINVLGNFIFGLPGDDEATMAATLRMAKRLRCEFANFYSAMAYPGSQLYGLAAPEHLPHSWAGYAQHGPECTPLHTGKIPGDEVLRFRDKAFDEYFSDVRYHSLVLNKFGPNAADQVQSMLGHRLERRILA